MTNLTNQPVRQKLDPPIRDRKHRQFVASLPCLVCGVQGLSQCAHIRIGWYRAGGRPGDNRTVPLCAERLGTMGCHSMQHNWRGIDPLKHASAEENFWETRGIDSLKIAAALYAISGDEEKGRLIVAGARTEGKVT